MKRTKTKPPKFKVGWDGLKVGFSDQSIFNKPSPFIITFGIAMGFHQIVINRLSPIFYVFSKKSFLVLFYIYGDFCHSKTLCHHFGHRLLYYECQSINQLFGANKKNIFC